MTKILAIATLAAVILGAIILAAPQSINVADEITGEVYSIGFADLTNTAQDAPVQKVASH